MLEQIASRYRILHELGRGGMGVVYVVEHIHTGEHLALKVLNSSGAADAGVIARFKREARVGAQIKSENIVRVTDADVAPELDGAPFFVMELLEGMDLEKLVAKAGPLSSEVVLSILSQVARPLDKAHSLGIVHRDLKPENIFLHWREDGTPIAKVLDFGISKFLHSDRREQADLGATQDGMLLGTPYYMAPEQARGEVDAIGPATDIWALGLLALRLLTAESYWTARSHAELMVQLLAGPLSQPSERWPSLGERFDSWFARSCDRNPSGRWTTVGEQVGSLRAVLEGLPVANGASMEKVVDLLRDAAARRVSPRPPAPAQSARESSDARTRTVTVVVPESFEASPDRGIGGTTAGTNLTRTAQPAGGQRRNRTLVFAAAIALSAVLCVLVYVLMTRPTTSAGSAASSPPTVPSVAPSVATTTQTPPPAGVETSNPRQIEPTELQPSENTEPGARTASPASSNRSAPRGTMGKPTPRVPRAPAAHPYDDPMRP